MASLPNTPYHVGEQSAAVLLGPIAAELATLEARLAHYVSRLRMPEADRATLERARALVAATRAELASLETTR